jgi:hypothetical protein
MQSRPNSRTNTEDNEMISEHNWTDLLLLVLSEPICQQQNSLLQLQNVTLQLQKGMLHLAETAKDMLKLSQNFDRRMIDYKIL